MVGQTSRIASSKSCTELHGFSDVSLWSVFQAAVSAIQIVSFGLSHESNKASIPAPSLFRGECPSKKSNAKALSQLETNSLRSLGNPLGWLGAAARKPFSLSMRVLPASVTPTLTVATGLLSFPKSSIRNLWPSVAGLPARIPNVGSALDCPQIEFKKRMNGSEATTSSI